ncbi:hypothetical protein BsWGS_20163 [Bradybaena similaris]
MSGWNSHTFHGLDAAVLQHPAPRVLDPSRPVRIETGMSVEEAYFIPIPQIDDAAYGSSGGKEEFCNKHNLLNSIAYINQELELLGLECLKYDGTRLTSGTVFIVNRLYDLLSLYHKTAKVKNDLEVRNHRLVCETDHLQSSVLRMKRLQEQTDRELDQEREKTRQICLKYSQVCNKLKSEKEEVKRLTAVLQSRDLQHKHEHKKKEREVCRLKERLHQLLADKVPDRKVGLELMKVINRRSEEGQRATWKTGPEKQVEEMYQILISNYEDRQQELIQENAEIRDCLLSLQRELSALLKRTTDLSVTLNMNTPSHADLSEASEDTEHSSPTYPSITDLDEGYFQMPYDIVRHDMERMFRETCKQISSSMKSCIKSLDKDHVAVLQSKPTESDPPERGSSGGRHSDDRAEIERLKKQVSNYKLIIQQQEHMMQHSLVSHPQSMDKTQLHESLLQEKENLSEQQKYFTEEKASFEKERRALTDAVICLSKEKLVLQDERAKLIKQHLLNLRPFKNSQHRRFKDGQSGRLLPATPVFSPAKTSGQVLASELLDSPDLYKAGGLSQLLDQMSGNISTVLYDQQDSSSASKYSDSLSRQLVVPGAASGTESPGHSTTPPSVDSLHRDIVANAREVSSSTLENSDTDDV